MTTRVIRGPIIRAGAALSEPLDCTDGQIVRIHMPSAWNAGAPVSFQISVDNVAWFDLYDHVGKEVTIPSVVPFTAVLVQVHQVRQVWVKFRSGWSANPQPQTSERTFQTVLELVAPGGPKLDIPDSVNMLLAGRLTLEK